MPHRAAPAGWPWRPMVLAGLLVLPALAAAAGMAPGMAAGMTPGMTPLPPPSGAVRVAVFNPRLERAGSGILLNELADPPADLRRALAAIRAARPDILLIESIERDPEGRTLAMLAARLAEADGAVPGLAYPHLFAGAVNAGEPSGLDLDGDGRVAGAGDAWGFGAFPGQYGMGLLSRFPIERAAIRSYRLFRWSALPGADRPRYPDGRPADPDATWQSLRLSSKSHWDVPVRLPSGRRLRLLAAHPTPPVFDGPEDRNGRRNADEIRLLAAMIDRPGWLTDDSGANPPPAPETPFVVLGTLNADPHDGDARRGGLAALLDHPRVQDPHPRSDGAARAAERDGGVNATHTGPAAEDTADWPDRAPAPGNLRVDYVLPAREIAVVGAGVLWPEEGEPGTSNHLVWVDLAIE